MFFFCILLIIESKKIFAEQDDIDWSQLQHNAELEPEPPSPSGGFRHSDNTDLYKDGLKLLRSLLAKCERSFRVDSNSVLLLSDDVMAALIEAKCLSDDDLLEIMVRRLAAKDAECSIELLLQMLKSPVAPLALLIDKFNRLNNSTFENNTKKERANSFFSALEAHCKWSVTKIFTPEMLLMMSPFLAASQYFAERLYRQYWCDLAPAFHQTCVMLLREKRESDSRAFIVNLSRRDHIRKLDEETNLVIHFSLIL